MVAKNSTDNISNRKDELVVRSTHKFLLDADDGASNFETKHMSLSTLKTRIVTKKTASYTVTNNDDIILCDPTSGVIIVTLPFEIQVGKTFTIMKTNSSSNAVEITPTPPQTISGASLVQVGPEAAMIVVFDGINWVIISQL